MIRRWVGVKPFAVWSFRFEREDGHFREISVPVGRGRFRMGSQREAEVIARRRLSEQYGDMTFLLEEGRRTVEPAFTDPGAELLRNNPDLHQDNYQLVEVRRV